VRREWRQLSVALSATVVVAAAAYLVRPDLWLAWIDLLRDSATGYTTALPLELRLPLAVVIVWWGARRGVYWAVPLAAMVALPMLRLNGFAMIAAIWALSSWPRPATHGQPDERDRDTQPARPSTAGKPAQVGAG
jgi:hypothetical protein